jgi:hypothetical protein
MAYPYTDAQELDWIWRNLIPHQTYDKRRETLMSMLQRHAPQVRLDWVDGAPRLHFAKQRLG